MSNPSVTSVSAVSSPSAVPPERDAKPLPGFVGLVAVLGLIVLGIVCFVIAGTSDIAPLVVPGLLAFFLAFVVLFGLFIVKPGEARVLVLLGRYVGTVKRDGWYFANPLAVRSGSGGLTSGTDAAGKPTVTKTPNNSKLSLKLRNLTTPVLKVNDAVGNPIEIGAIIGWQVADTAKARFGVENVDQFVLLQTETAVRHLATEFAYDSHDGEAHSLRANPDEAASRLEAELRSRLSVGGVELVEARVSHLAYAPEIAEAMLRRQQAQAVVAARRTIVNGAVGMVEDALDKLAAHGVVNLDEERKAAMVTNLLVVLTGEHQAKPVVNVGTLY